MRSADVTADILYILSDGEIHTLREVADEVEVSYTTAQRHVAALSYRYPIQPIFRRDGKQGMRLSTSRCVNGKVITTEKLQILSRALELLQDSNCDGVDRRLLAELVRDFATSLNKNGRDYENQTTETSGLPTKEEPVAVAIR